MRIGFVIWGVRFNGFNSDLLSSALEEDVRAALGDELHQVCGTQREPFLEVRRTQQHLLVSIFKPDALDHVGRRAYIGITVFVPHGCRLQALNGSVPEAMHKLLAYYEEKQGRVVERNQFTAGMFQAQVNGLLEAVDGIQIRSQGHKRGYAVYSAQQEAEWFQGMELGDYRRVFFFREVPEMEAAGLAGYEPFDPNKKVEEVRAEERVYDGSMHQRRRRAGRRKHSGLIIATVLGLSLLVVGGGAWWVLDEDQLPVPTTHAPTDPDTASRRASDILEAEKEPIAAETQDSATEQSWKPAVVEVVATGANENAQKEGTKKEDHVEVLSIECEKWCQRENKKSTMKPEEKEAHDSKGQELDCPCKKK